MDFHAHGWANKLLENATTCATIELTIGMAAFRAEADLQIALTGANTHAQLDGQPVGNWCSLTMKQGQTLTLKAASNGMRAYLGVKGGFQVEPVLGSDLVDLRSEALWNGATRRGHPELTPESGVRGPFPALGGGVAGSSAALVFRVGGAADATEITFRRECFLGVAQRATARLVAAGALRAGDEFECAKYRLRFADARFDDGARRSFFDARLVVVFSERLAQCARFRRSRVGEVLASGRSSSPLDARPGRRVCRSRRPQRTRLHHGLRSGQADGRPSLRLA